MKTDRSSPPNQHLNQYLFKHPLHLVHPEALLRARLLAMRRSKSMRPTLHISSQGWRLQQSLH